MTPRRYDEVERKYDVDQVAMLPPLTDVEGVSAVGQPVEHQLGAVYFDTADLALARHGATLRRRTGGDDAGWHLKLAKRKDARTELRLPLGPAAETVPEDLLAPVRALVRDHPVVPVARVSTRRLEHALLGLDDVVLAEVCDDEVRAERLHGPALVQAWREWEVELVTAGPALLDLVEQRLLCVGASPAAAASKLARSLGDALPPSPGNVLRKPSPKKGRKKLSGGSAALVLWTYLTEQVAELHTQDIRLRGDEPGSVHKLRIAARRLRAALKTYKPLFAPGAADTVGEELRWLGQVLSGARDAQVLREHLHAVISSEPPELVLGPVLARIDDELRAAARTGRTQALQALESERYFRLLDALDELVGSGSLVPEADRPARKVLPRLLQRDAKRLDRAVRQIARADHPQQHEAALHEARKKAKRLRYAAESTVPALGKRAARLATATKKVQQALGEHQDTVVARDRLREYGVKAHVNGENGFTFGRLHALEQARGVEAERQFEMAWKALPPAQDVRRWVNT
jgi:CHAD domain-containing protein